MHAKRIGILGSGAAGKALASGFARHGWDVLVGTRSPEKLAEWRASAMGHVQVGTFAQAVAHADVVVVATLGEATEAVLGLAGGPRAFEGKLVLDATNPLAFDDDDSPPGLFVGTTDSLGERIQRALPGAQVVKCFNTVPNAKMVDPIFEGGAPLMPICGDDAGAKKRTESILREIGWPGVLDAGGIDGARWLEALVPLWVRAGIALGRWDHAFRVVH